MDDHTIMYTPRFSEALAFTAAAFAAKSRKVGGAPYVGHLLGVCRLVMDNGGSEMQMIAALLHDYYEDLHDGKSDKSLLLKFGPTVEDLVVALTESKGGPWKERKLAYIDRLRTAHADVKLIAIADKIDNLTDLCNQLDTLGDDKVWKHFHSDPKSVYWYYSECCDAMRNGWKHPLLDYYEQIVVSLGLHLANSTVDIGLKDL